MATITNSSTAGKRSPAVQVGPMPAFSQALDTTRPHSLLTRNAANSGCLEYRYDDTGLHVRVPNCPYNQPYWMRVDYLRNWLARNADLKAEQWLRNPPFGASPEQAKAMALKHQTYARTIRAEADRMERAGSSTHPVAASSMILHFGPPPG